MMKHVVVALAGTVWAALSVQAETMTNVWHNADGGLVPDPANWQDGLLPDKTRVVDYTALANGKTIKSGKLDKPDESYTYNAAIGSSSGTTPSI